MKKNLSIVIALLFSIPAQSQITNFDSLYNAIQKNSVTWYGLDFSHFRVVKAGSVEHAEQTKEIYVPNWIHYFSAQYPINEKMKSIIGKGVDIDSLSIQELYKNINKDSIITIMDYTLDANRIQQIVNGYLLPNANGVGFVVIVEKIKDSQKYMGAYFTFFDITTKRVISSTYLIGEPQGFAYSQKWVGATERMFMKFSDRYEDDLHTFKKELKKKH